MIVFDDARNTENMIRIVDPVEELKTSGDCCPCPGGDSRVYFGQEKPDYWPENLRFPDPEITKINARIKGAVSHNPCWWAGYGCSFFTCFPCAVCNIGYFCIGGRVAEKRNWAQAVLAELEEFNTSPAAKELEASLHLTWFLPPSNALPHGWDPGYRTITTADEYASQETHNACERVVGCICLVLCAFTGMGGVNTVDRPQTVLLYSNAAYKSSMAQKPPVQQMIGSSPQYSAPVMGFVIGQQGQNPVQQQPMFAQQQGQYPVQQQAKDWKDELVELNELRKSGAIDEDEFKILKAKVLAKKNDS